jgi:carboxypeptidase family protein/TonB-dependent receptor-like protein
MNRSVMRLGRVVLFAAVFASSVGSLVYAQGGTTQTLSGTVVDVSGAVIPGADVAAKHAGTGVVSNAVSNAEGLFSMASMPIGTYTVTVTLQGFKTVNIQNVVLTSTAGANVKATMEVGGISEQVTVSSASEVVQTQSSTVSTTVNTNQISKLPITSRSAMDFVNMLPGVTTANGNRQAVINGLPRGTINITLDGVNIQDNTLRTTDGFFAIVSPRLDAIEEVSVSTAAQGAGDSGQGAVQVKFVTRGGTNSFTGSGYYYERRDRFNANTWFNNRNGVAKAKLKQDQGGFRAGGPIVIPGLFDGHNKAFFFANYEELRQPSEVTRNNRTVLNPAAQAGNYSYVTGGQTVTVNVLQLAAANGQVAGVDPIVGKLLGDIRSAIAGGSLSDIDPNLQRFAFNVPVQSKRIFPTFRLDYNVTSKNRASFAYNYQKFTDYPDTLNNREASFPGFPVAAGQSSVRLGWSSSMRSTLTRNLVNEARLGYSGAPVSFFSELNPGMYTGTLANQAGFQLNFPAVGSGLTRPSAGASPQSRNANSLLVEDTLNWLKGSHSISMGGTFTQFDIWAKNSSLLPTISFGVLGNDPANPLFSAANFPGASAAQTGAAANLYALLTGRVTQIAADARLDESGKYVYQGTGLQRGRLREYGVFAQDSWRIRQNMTLNLGVRYDIQQPFYALNSLYSQATIQQVCGLSGAASDNACNLFKPGTQPGARSTYSQFTAGSKAHNTDLNNFSPTLGFAWTPAARPGVLRPLMGDGDFVVRAGYNRAYSRPGLNDYTGRLGANPGIVINADRNSGNGLLGAVPLLLSETARLGPPPIPASPAYPLSPAISDSINTFDPNLQVPSTDSFTAGIQRSIGKSMAVEVRYVRTNSRDNWSNLNYNEFNIVENGFLNEFRQAQANLQANIAAGRGNTFAFTGAPGTAPLPTFLAYYNAQPTANAGNAALYTGANWTNSTFLGFLAARNPNPFGFASTNTTNGLQGNATFRGNALTAGIPANYFLANPEANGGAIVVSNLNKTRYNALQFEFRRRFTQGLQFNGSYAFGHQYDSNFTSFRRPLFYERPFGNTGDIPHAFKANVVYDMPFGRGRRFGGNAHPIVDRIIGGWQVGVVSRLQSGTPINLGNVRLVGMSAKDVQNAFKLRFDDANKQVYMFPEDIIANTILAHNVSATTASGYSGNAPTGRYFAPANGPDCIEIAGAFGDCGSRATILNGPRFQQHDIRVAKRTRIAGNTNLEFAAQLLNAFNHPNFLAVSGIGNTTLAGYQLTGLQGQEGSRVIQFELRFNW